MKSDLTAKERLYKMSKDSRRKDMIEDGAYDGRFKKRVETPKQYKKPKYKHKLYESEY